MSTNGVRALLILLSLFAFSACRPISTPSVRSASATANGSTSLASNVLREDYAGSAACARCHVEISRSWSQTPMHHMTRLPSTLAPGEIRAPFTGEFRFKEDRVRFEKIGVERFMSIESAKEGTRRFRVTKVIGGHHREDFAGIEVAVGGDVLKAVAKHGERVLPASYSLTTGAWRYKGYSVMSPERPGLRPGAEWSRTCIFCHNTEPYLSTILGALSGPGTPPYQGEVVDALLPAGRRASYEVTNPDGLGNALVREIEYLGEKAPSKATAVSELLAQAVKTTRSRFGESHLVEVGIGCESCHLGSRAHVEDVSVMPSMSPVSPFIRVRPPSPAKSVKEAKAQAINRTCARCHQVLFSQYQWTWEGGRRRGAETPGGSQINSGEGRDFLLGGCASEMSCVACHDPHAPNNAARMRDLEGAAGDMICQSCHTRYSGDAAVRAHTHHDPSRPGARCLGCHMPKKNMSLDNGLTRYHRIGSPTDRERVERDRPLECALCHADKTVSRLTDDMQRFWGKSYDGAALTKLYGALDANVLRATLTMGKPHEQATAMAILGENRVREAVPLIAAQLTHPVPIVRYYAVNALTAIFGKPFEIDLFQDNAKIRSDAEALLRVAGTLESLPPPPVNKAVAHPAVEVEED